VLKMSYQNQKIADVAELLRSRLAETDDKASILKAAELRALYAEIPLLALEARAEFGKEINDLKLELEALVANYQTLADGSQLAPIDVTAPYDINTPAVQRPCLLQAETGSVHPLMDEMAKVLDIFGRMGFDAIESRELDDEYHMFTSLNFPEGHPARDDYDTFMTIEKDQNGKPLVAPAHVSIMQNRLLKKFASNLENDKPISAVYTGRTFRNEDVDARHEHTFYQVELLYVDKGINAGNLVATFKTFLQEYYEQDIEIKSQPFYFPFTEPSFELALSCPFCQKRGCNICSQSGWIELLGMGMVNPNVLKHGGIDSSVYTGFAGGMGLDRLVMMKYGIEDVRHFHSGKLEFLRQFA